MSSSEIASQFHWQLALIENPLIDAILMAKMCSNSLKINAPFRLPKIKLLGTLSNGDSNERWKSSRFRLVKQQLISLLSLHDYNVKVPKFMFC